MATPGSPAGGGSNAAAGTMPSSPIGPARPGSNGKTESKSQSDASPAAPESATPSAAPDADKGTSAKRKRKTPARPKEAERDEQNGVERPSSAEIAKAEPPPPLDPRIAADIAKLAARRARDREEAERVLEATRTKEAKPLATDDTPSKPGAAKERAPTPTPAPAPTPTSDKKDSDRDGLRLPREVEDQFVRVGDKFFDRDNPKQQAFVFTGQGLETSSNKPGVARAFAAIAEANWQDGIKVKGSAEFKREVFIEASTRGIRVIGYKPQDADLAEIESRVARMANLNAIEPATARAQEFRSLSSEEAMRRPDLASAAIAADAVAKLGDAVRDPKLRARLQGGFREQLARGMERGDTPRSLDDPKVGARIKVPEGEFIEANRAPYNFDKDEKDNFYVRYRRADGSVGVAWGKGLEVAMKDANVAPGDTIRLERQGAKPVRVIGNVRDDQNRVVGRKEIDAKLNEWNVEVVKRAQERAVPPPERSKGR